MLDSLMEYLGTMVSPIISTMFGAMVTAIHCIGRIMWNGVGQ